MFLCFYLSYVPLCLTVLIQFSTAQFFIYYSVSLFFISVILTTTFVLNFIFSAFLSPILLFKVFFCLLWFGISYRLIVFLRFFLFSHNLMNYGSLGLGTLLKQATHFSSVSQPGYNGWLSFVSF